MGWYEEQRGQYHSKLDSSDTVEVEKAIEAAAQAIKEADFVLITAGAGMGCDSGCWLRFGLGRLGGHLLVWASSQGSGSFRAAGLGGRWARCCLRAPCADTPSRPRVARGGRA